MDQNTKESVQTLFKLKQSRRQMLGALGIGAIAGVGLLSGARPASATAVASKGTPYPTDVAVLNFALNLEYLEAEFYSIAYLGEYLSGSGYDVTSATKPNGTAGTTGGGTTVGNGATPTGGNMVDFGSNAVSKQAARQITTDERTHVQELRTIIINLGGVPIAEPQIDLDALGIGYASVAEFLILSRAFEDTGVSAYAGAAGLLTRGDIITYAAQILAVEAYHASNARLQLIEAGISAPKLDNKDVPPTIGMQFTTISALAVTRTVPEVLSIVYGGTGKTSGGFFPNGVNGAFNGTMSA